MTFGSSLCFPEFIEICEKSKHRKKAEQCFPILSCPSSNTLRRRFSVWSLDAALAHRLLEVIFSHLFLLCTLIRLICLVCLYWGRRELCTFVESSVP